MISDDDYTRAGLLPPGFVLKARTREAKREYSEWEDECVAYIDDGVAIPGDDLVEWVDWQINIFLRVCKEERIAWGNPVWWSVKQEETRREKLAAFKLEHDYISQGHPYPGKEWRGTKIR